MAESHRASGRAGLTISRLSIALPLLIGVFGLSAGHFGWFQTPAPAMAGQSLSASAPAGQSADATRGFADLAKAVKPAVVNITPAKTERIREGLKRFFPEDFDFPGPSPFDRRRGHRDGGERAPRHGGMGSGVIVSADGYILTNNHVVEGANELTVALSDKREFKGRLIGSDPKTDLAVIKIEARDLPFIPWGDSSQLQVGEYVLAVGNPFGLNSTVTLGIVSAVGRGRMGITQYEDFIQTDAAINPGNSGGALVNTRGQLVGINTAIFSQTGGYQGIGFAVPTSMAQPVYERTKTKMNMPWPVSRSLRPTTGQPVTLVWNRAVAQAWSSSMFSQEARPNGLD
jgi:serine protease Do